MFWTIISYIAVFLLGAVVSLVLITKAVNQRLEQAVAFTQYFAEVVEQLGRNQEFLMSLPVRDQRLQQILQSNQRILAKLSDDSDIKTEKQPS